MKKFINTIIISSFLGLGFANANSIQNSLESQIATNKISTISQNDMNFLFNEANQVDVALLDNQEMKDTKGEFLPFIISYIGYSAFANAPTSPNSTIWHSTLNTPWNW